MNTAVIAGIDYRRDENRIDVRLSLTAHADEHITLKFQGIERIIWTHDKCEDAMYAFRLSVEDIFLLAKFEGCGLEILARDLAVE